jgi:hypothetical protein
MKMKDLMGRCTADVDLTNEIFLESLKKALPYVRRFCSASSVSLLRVEASTEQGVRNSRREPLYVFSDKLGGYVLEGLRASL